MEKRWKNLGILLVLVVVFIGVYFFVLQTPVVPVEEELDLTAIKSLAAKNNVEFEDLQLDFADFFNENMELIEVISVEQLDSLKLDLQEQGSKLGSEGERKAAELYLQYIDFLKERKELYNEIALLDEKTCLELPPYAELQEKSDGLVEKAGSLVGQQEEFQETYNSDALFLLDLESEVELNQSLRQIYMGSFNKCEMVKLIE